MAHIYFFPCSVFELPQRLRVAIDAGAFVGAVDSVIASRPVLNRAGYKVHLVSDRHSANTQIAVYAYHCSDGHLIGAHYLTPGG